ncbi:ABC transporter ATP-binding protein [Chitinophaga sancti]|uniref:ABC transporter ATP-binding protein n=1 Tax=Chitinophaga sancti TaxID=1004 RepID=A0A1K1PIH2_9BACT|nr:ABC transporter ATP-binding protein [Chitinophaga sancti]WQD65861.1 ABC transporter ATP-binding protein [Chitinophaga sancti]WQG88517.1 ABC transporter ATP-binding protein [Chitinophaga sancti]SFW46454.1 ATP-binding cassette, subfamily B [Chitinophaga sancti]
MKLFLHYLKRYKWLIGLALLLASINQVFSLLDPYIFGKLIDQFANHPTTTAKGLFRDQGDYISGVILLLLASMGVAMVSRIAKAFQDYFTNVIIQKFGASVYTDGLKHSLRLPYQQFEDQRSGETLAVLQKVRTDSEKFITAFVNVLFVALVGVIFVMVYAYSVHPSLVFVYTGGCLLLAWMMNVLSRKIKTIQKTIVKETTMLAGATTESLRNIELVKSLGLTHQEIRRLNSTTIRILMLELKKVRSIRSISFVQGTFVNFLRQAILFLLLYLIYGATVTVGQLFTLQLYSFFIFGPLQELGNIILAYREAQVSLLNFQRILETPVEETPPNPVRISAIESLTFENVGFQHLTASSKALDQINFTVKTGETVAFVGPSGSGKTTLVKLLVGLYNPAEGSISYNGIKSSEIDIEELRAQIGFVTQDTQLFSGTIRENLLFVNPRASDEDMLRVLKQASCDTLLARGDNGLDTMIGEGGMKVSGGEKQRLSIARALLRHPRLLVFDEATSALDSLTEEAISNTVREITATREHITVMIAHRLSTIMHADRIFVLEKGRIIETGNHIDLLAEKGLYYAMWRQQIGER